VSDYVNPQIQRIREANAASKRAREARESGDYVGAARLSLESADLFGGGTEAAHQTQIAAGDMASAGFYDRAEDLAISSVGYVLNHDQYTQDIYRGVRDRQLEAIRRARGR
jgi:hypothetical protein